MAKRSAVPRFANILSLRWRCANRKKENMISAHPDAAGTTSDHHAATRRGIQARTGDDPARPPRARAWQGQGLTRIEQNQGEPGQTKANQSLQPNSEPAWARIRQCDQSQNQAKAHHHHPDQSGPAMVSQDQLRPSRIVASLILPKPGQGVWDRLSITSGGQTS